MKKHELAVEEWRLLEQVIMKQEETRLKLRNWEITVVAALTVAHLSADLGLAVTEYALLTSAILGLFWTLEGIYHIAERKAIHRVSIVERALRGELEYDGPRIALSMATKAPGTWGKRLGGYVQLTLKSMFYARIATPNLALLALIAIVSLLSPVAK